MICIQESPPLHLSASAQSGRDCAIYVLLNFDGHESCFSECVRVDFCVCRRLGVYKFQVKYCLIKHFHAFFLIIHFEVKLSLFPYFKHKVLIIGMKVLLTYTGFPRSSGNSYQNIRKLIKIKPSS